MPNTAAVLGESMTCIASSDKNEENLKIGSVWVIDFFLFKKNNSLTRFQHLGTYSINIWYTIMHSFYSRF